MRIQDADIACLLGREAVEPDQDLLKKNNNNKVVLVTGAGGSIGSELCRQIVKQRPSLLILYEISEYALYSIHIELMRVAPDVEIKPIIGSVNNTARVESVLKKFGVHTIYHAAAYKHVPMVEYNIIEGLINNFVGTATVAKAAKNAKVKVFVLVSTDKAVRPTNVMGATKRLSEMYLQALNHQGSDTTFCMVRFGNVLGSSGSVVPLFLEYISRKEPLPITHPEITRYFMTIPEASQLVIQAGAMAEGGEVFVLDMGEPVKIIDMARRMLDLYGMDRDNIVITGLRPGEKLYEELLIGDDVTSTVHPKISKAHEQFKSFDMMDELSNHLLNLDQFDINYESILRLIGEFVDGFNHSGEIKDHLYEFT